ncbi:MAG: MATE family efflux transporter [Silicimonas sp.]|nr:MATE family efflux transporter [Silicimonas sp.]
MPQESIQPQPRPSVGAQARALLVLGLPLIGSHVAQTLISVTDTLMMGWYGIPELAALSLAGPIYYIVFIFGSGFAWAVMPMVASYAANDDDRQIRRVTRMGLWLSILFGLLALPLFFTFGTLFLIMGQEPEISRLAGVYMSIMGFGLIPTILVMVLKSYLSALELTRAILIATLAAVGLNALTNYMLIFGNWGAPELGVAGAGFASLFSNLFSFAALAVYAVWRRPDHELFRNFHKPDWEAFGRVFRLGWPIGATSVAEVALFAASTVMMGWVGTIALAAHGIALNIASLTFMIHVGLSQAITVRVGKAWGRKDRETLRVASIAGMALSLVAAVLIAAAFVFFPDPLVGAFVDPNEPQRVVILTTGATLLAVAALFQLVDSGQVMALGMLRGVQDTRVPMIMAIVSYWLIGLPVSYLLGFTFEMGGVGIWLGLTVGLAGACVMMQARFWRRYG